MNPSQRARLGALTLHAQGKTNTRPARQAFFERFVREVDPDMVLPPAEREKRARLALRAHMIRLSARAHS